MSSYQRIDIPIRRVSNNSHYTFNKQHTENEIQLKDTTTQWINDPITNKEKFRMKINIEGFNQNEVRIRVEGNKLFVYGERIENKSQGTSKKIIERSYELPSDIDTFRPQVTFPSPITMQVDFPSKHSPTRSTPSSGYSLIQKLNATENAISGSSYNDLFNHNTHRIPIHRVSITSRNAPTKQTFTETRRETHRKLSSPITGIQSSYEFEHKRSNSPALSDIIEEDSFRRSITPTSSTDSDTSSSTSIFPRDFNSDTFYQSIFQPEIFTDDRNKKYIEMKLDIHDYNPDKIKVSINDNDLIVHVEHTNFYKQITLPSNVDFTSLALHYHHDKKLYITVKLLDEHSSFKYI